MKKLSYVAIVITIVFAAYTNVVVNAQVPEINVYFFHNNACESCGEIEKLTKILDEKDLSQKRNYNIVEVKAYKSESINAVESLKDLATNTNQKYAYPTLVVGDKILSGYDEISSGFEAAIKAYSVENKNNFSFSNDDSSKGDLENTGISNELPKIDSRMSYGVLFVTKACESCEKVKKHIDTLPKTIDINNTMSEVKIEEKSIMDEVNLQLLQQLFEKYDVPSLEQKVPILFLRDTYLSGEENINTDLLQMLEDGKGLSFEYPSVSDGESGVNYFTTILTGLLNGLNPCSLSMILLLLSLLVNVKSKILKYGIAFVVGKFIAYLLIGLILSFTLFALNYNLMLQIKQITVWILLTISIVLALMNIFDFLYAYKEQYGKIKLQLPQKLRKINHALIEKIVANKNAKYILILFLVGGVAISVGEFMCTGQIYLANILYFSQSVNASVLLNLMLYVFFMCVPSLTLVVLASTGKNILSMSEFSRKNIPMIKLLNALLFIIMIVLAISML